MRDEEKTREQLIEELESLRSEVVEFKASDTERKRAEEKLRLSEERFSKAFFSSPAGMTITRTTDGKFIDVNDAFLRMFEFSREEVIGHTFTELNMWMQEERKKLIQKQLESGGLHDFELQARSKTGRFVKILFSSNPIDLEGETCHITTMIDITERKRAEEALKESEGNLQRVIDGSSAVIFVKDLNGKYLLINSLFEKLFHVSKAEVIGKTDYDLFPKDAADALRDADNKALTADKPIEAEEIVPQDDGIHYYISLKFPLYDVHGKPYAVCGIATDITERKKAEETLKQRLDELMRFEKATSQREFRMRELKEEVKRLKEKIEEMEGKG